MKKFEFSLAHMRDYRERLLDEEKGKLLRLRGEQNAIEQHIFRLENEFSQTSFDRPRAPRLLKYGSSARSLTTYGCRFRSWKQL